MWTESLPAFAIITGAVAGTGFLLHGIHNLFHDEVGRRRGGEEPEQGGPREGRRCSPAHRVEAPASPRPTSSAAQTRNEEERAVGMFLSHLFFFLPFFSLLFSRVAAAPCLAIVSRAASQRRRGGWLREPRGAEMGAGWLGEKRLACRPSSSSPRAFASHGVLFHSCVEPNLAHGCPHEPDNKDGGGKKGQPRSSNAPQCGPSPPVSLALAAANPTPCMAIMFACCLAGWLSRVESAFP